MQTANDRAAFDCVADQYATVLNRGLAATGETSSYFARTRVAWVARRMKELGRWPSSVLDFGCGTGMTTSFLLEILQPTELVGLDTSALSLEEARKSNSDKRVVYRRPDECEPDAKIDLVYCTGVFHHICPLERPHAAGYIARCLRPGGVCAIWENTPWNPGTRYVMNKIPFDKDAIVLWPRELRRLLRNAGLDYLRTDYLFIFPRMLRHLRAVEPYLSWLPLGAQYQVLFRKAEDERSL